MNNEKETAPVTPDGAVIIGDIAKSQDDKKDKSEHSNAIYTLVIAGQIEGHSSLPQGQKATKYELIIPQLISAEESDDIGGLLLVLNTVGGDVEAGLALAELVASMKKPTASIVLGGGHSIGVPLAVSTKRSFIVPSATMTLHPVRTSGVVLGAPQSFEHFLRMQERIVGFITSHSKISAERLRELMLKTEELTTDMGSILEGEAAVNEGLIDGIGGLSDALEYLNASVAKNAVNLK